MAGKSSLEGGAPRFEDDVSPAAFPKPSETAFSRQQNRCNLSHRLEEPFQDVVGISVGWGGKIFTFKIMKQHHLLCSDFVLLVI